MKFDAIASNEIKSPNRSNDFTRAKQVFHSEAISPSARAHFIEKYGYDLYKTYDVWKLTDNFDNEIVIYLDPNCIFVEITFAMV